MIWYPIRAFVYGFVLFGGMLLVTDLAFSTDLQNDPIWGTKPTLMLASAGGLLFVFSWLCLFLLWKFLRELMRSDADA